MRFIDKMKIDLNTVEGLAKIKSLHCWDFCDKEIRESCVLFNPKTPVESIYRCQAEHLLAEAPTKKIQRWELYKTEDGDIDFAKALNDFNKWAKQFAWPSRDLSSPFAHWLMEEIEVEI